jgi:hypothetical protein
VVVTSAWHFDEDGAQVKGSRPGRVLPGRQLLSGTRSAGNATRERARAAENRVNHVRRDTAGERVLLAWVVAAEKQHRRAARTTQLSLRSVGEPGLRAR